jgi:hypothetical protein
MIKVIDSVTLEGYVLDSLPKVGEANGPEEFRPFLLAENIIVIAGLDPAISFQSSP